MAAPTGLTVTASEIVGAAPFAASITAEATDPDSGPVTIRVQWPDSTVTTVDSGDPATHTITDPTVAPIIITAYDASMNASLATILTAVIDAPDGLEMMDRADGTCGTPWFLPGALSSCPAYNNASSDDRQLVTDSAIRFVNHATCYKWRGICTALIRPPENLSGCRVRSTHTNHHDPGYDLSWWVPGPIRKITDVVVDGEVIDPRFYRLVNNKRIKPQAPVGEDGPLDPWPVQFLDRPIGAVGTWYVVVEWGRVPPPALVNATRRLACEFLKALYGQDCAFPDGVTSVSRDGMTMSFAPRQPGQTGIPSIDMVIERFGCDRPHNVRRLADPAAEKAEVRRYR